MVYPEGTFSPSLSGASPYGRLTRVAKWTMVSGEIACGLVVVVLGLVRMDFWPVRPFRAVPRFDAAFWWTATVALGLAGTALASALAHILCRVKVPASHWLCLRGGLRTILATEVMLFARGVMVNWR